MRNSASGALARLACAWVVCTVVAAPRLGAHEIASDVTIRVIVEREHDALRLAVRAPLEAMRDVSFPTRGPGYLDVERADDALADAARLWLTDSLEIRADGERVANPALRAVRASIPSDRSFTDFASASAHVRSPPLAPDTQIVWRQAMLDALLEAPVGAAREAVSIRPGFERLGLRVTTIIRFESRDGRVRMYHVEGDAGFIELDPRWHAAALRFVAQGFRHMTSGADHLLFLLCLVLPFHGRPRALVLIVTAFTAAHSLTLIGSAYGLAPAALWFAPLVETLIAASILYMALENIVAPSVRVRWIVAFAFGLVHGFGFASALRDTLQFAGDHVIVSLLAFNVGLELAQLLVLALLVPVLHVVLGRLVPERIAVIVLSIVVAHAAWHWMADRFDVLDEYALLTRAGG